MNSKAEFFRLAGSSVNYIEFGEKTTKFILLNGYEQVKSL